MRKIHIYKKPDLQGTGSLAFFSVAMYCINNYLETLKSENPKFYQKYHKLYLMTDNCDSEGMDEEGAQGYEDMLDEVDRYLVCNVSGGWEFKFRVLLSAAVLFLIDAKPNLIASSAYAIQEGINEMLLGGVIKDNQYRIWIGSQAAKPYNDLLKALKFYSNDPKRELGRSLYNHCKLNLFVTYKP
jgi:hypothetical protein